MTPELLADERAVGCLDEVGSRDASREESRRIPRVDENAKVPLLPVIENDLRLHSKHLPVIRLHGLVLRKALQRQEVVVGQAAQPRNLGGHPRRRRFMMSVRHKLRIGALDWASARECPPTG
jgi:hypothetical protein